MRNLAAQGEQPAAAGQLLCLPPSAAEPEPRAPRRAGARAKGSAEERPHRPAGRFAFPCPLLLHGFPFSFLGSGVPEVSAPPGTAELQLLLRAAVLLPQSRQFSSLGTWVGRSGYFYFRFSASAPLPIAAPTLVPARCSFPACGLMTAPHPWHPCALPGSRGEGGDPSVSVTGSPTPSWEVRPLESRGQHLPSLPGGLMGARSMADFSSMVTRRGDGLLFSCRKFYNEK